MIFPVHEVWQPGKPALVRSMSWTIPPASVVKGMMHVRPVSEKNCTPMFFFSLMFIENDRCV